MHCHAGCRTSCTTMKALDTRGLDVRGGMDIMAAIQEMKTSLGLHDNMGKAEMLGGLNRTMEENLGAEAAPVLRAVAYQNPTLRLGERLREDVESENDEEFDFEEELLQQERKRRKGGDFIEGSNAGSRNGAAHAFESVMEHFPKSSDKGKSGQLSAVRANVVSASFAARPAPVLFPLISKMSIAPIAMRERSVIVRAKEAEVVEMERNELPTFVPPTPPQSSFSTALTSPQAGRLSYHFSQLSRQESSMKQVDQINHAEDLSTGKGSGPAAHTRLQSRKLLELQKLRREEERWQPFEEESFMDQNSLPNDLLELCLVRLPWRTLVRLRLVCKRWRNLLLSPSFLSLRALLGYHEPWLFIFKPESRDSEAAILAYDPVHKKSQFIRAPILSGRNHYSLVVGGGLIYLVGGCCPSSSALVYNPVNNTWTELPPMHHARDMPAVGVIQEMDEKGQKRTKLIVAGGKGLSRRCLSSAEIYDPVTNRWSYIMSLPPSFREVRFGTVHNGKLLVYSRRLNLINEVASYDVEKGLWTRVPMTHNPTAPPRYHHFHLVSCGGKLFKVEDGPHMKEETSISVWSLDESKMEWVEVAPIPPLEKGTWLWYIGCVAGKENQCMIYLYEVNYPNLMSIRCCVCDLKTARAHWQWVTDMPYMVHPNDLTAIVQL